MEGKNLDQKQRGTYADQVRSGFDLIVVATDGEDVDVVPVEPVYHPVALAEPARPEAGEILAQRFRLAGSGGRIIAKHFLQDDAKRSVQAFIAGSEFFTDCPGISFKRQGSHRLHHPLACTRNAPRGSGPIRHSPLEKR